jgi:hypothetical protein
VDKRLDYIKHVWRRIKGAMLIAGFIRLMEVWQLLGTGINIVEAVQNDSINLKESIHSDFTSVQTWAGKPFEKS